MTKPYTLHRGDVLDVLRTMPDNSVDSICTDPPYELGFMGKSWDASGIAYNVDMWREALRVLKPGGHLLAFSGSRTYHRMACAIEDAGFEIRDQIMWVYGSGFPKSMDVSKAMDKRGGNPHLTAEIGAAIKTARERRGLSATECDRRFCGGSTNWSWFEGRKGEQRAPTPNVFALIVAEWPELAPLAEKVGEAAREVIGQSATKSGISAGNGNAENGSTWDKVAAHYDITSPATEAARQWEGWGTALKPAHEPICVARKPLVKGSTVAANVLEFGTGALNIGACRVPTDDNLNGGAYAKEGGRSVSGSLSPSGMNVPGKTAGTEFVQPEGRWPANLIHDGSDEVVTLFPSEAGGQDMRTGLARGKRTGMGGVGNPSGSNLPNGRLYGDTGSAARFFYCAKASRADRNEGMDDPGTQFQHGSTLRDAENLAGKRNGNHHPTVKPTDLMAYLCRLVTPPGGMVLDQFMGSGSTGKACMREGFRFTGIDMTPEYVDIATARIEHELAKVQAAATARAEEDAQPVQLSLLA